MKKLTMSLIGAATVFTVLCLPFFIHYQMNENYLQLYPISLGTGIASIIACIFSFIKGNRFHFCIPDYIFLTLIIYYIARYDYTLQLANWKVIFAFLSLPLWFSFRIILSHYYVSKQWILNSIIAVGCLISIWGLLQLYDYLPSNHSLFAITGPFYNPGPYSGYVAIIFCITLSCWLQSKENTRYIWFAAMALMGCILPAGMSRSAWTGIFVSSLWMFIVHFQCYKHLKLFFKNHLYKSILTIATLSVTLCLGSYLIFQIKSDSAYGRLFIWKNTCTAICDAPLFGHGPGSFPKTYGKAQAEYFAKGNYTETEERVAGAPEYAFNEILQLGIEGGIILILLGGTFFFLNFKARYTNGNKACYSALITALGFSIFSYPLQILPLNMLIILITSVNVSKESAIPTKRLFPILSIATICTSFGVIYTLRDTRKHQEYWSKSNILYANKAYIEASKGYEISYDLFKHNPDYLFRYAKSLIAQKEHSKADSILQRLQVVSCNPMSYCLQGNNYLDIKDYRKAEKAYRHAQVLLPGRIYPYYLLAKLYAIPEYKNKEKMKEAGNIVLNKSPKVQSKAIEKMRTEINELLMKKL